LPKRIIVPAASQEGLNANLAEHFGRAPYFAVVDLNENGEVANVKTVPNVGEHTGRTGQPHDVVLGLQPTAIIVYGMGHRGIISFQSAGVAVLRANANTISEVIAAYKENKLQELTEGCHDARHPYNGS
jgi:predicted Fe-Mo cluster-binding NifX family protein